MKLTGLNLMIIIRVYTGLTTLIDIKNLEPGKHVLILSSKDKSYESQIVFWKDYPQKIPF